MGFKRALSCCRHMTTHNVFPLCGARVGVVCMWCIWSTGRQFDTLINSFIGDEFQLAKVLVYFNIAKKNHIHWTIANKDSYNQKPYFTLNFSITFNSYSLILIYQRNGSSHTCIILNRPVSQIQSSYCKDTL